MSDKVTKEKMLAWMDGVSGEDVGSYMEFKVTEQDAACMSAIRALIAASDDKGPGVGPLSKAGTPLTRAEAPVDPSPGPLSVDEALEALEDWLVWSEPIIDPKVDWHEALAVLRAATTRTVTRGDIEVLVTCLVGWGRRQGRLEAGLETAPVNEIIPDDISPLNYAINRLRALGVEVVGEEGA